MRKIRHKMVSGLAALTLISTLFPSIQSASAASISYGTGVDGDLTVSSGQTVNLDDFYNNKYGANTYLQTSNSVPNFRNINVYGTLSLNSAHDLQILASGTIHVYSGGKIDVTGLAGTTPNLTHGNQAGGVGGGAGVSANGGNGGEGASGGQIQLGVSYGGYGAGSSGTNRSTGNGGGHIILSALNIVVDSGGYITANGLPGAAPTTVSQNGSGGGGGGLIEINSKSTNWANNSLQAYGAGGSGGSGGNGGNGGNGDASTAGASWVVAGTGATGTSATVGTAGSGYNPGAGGVGGAGGGGGGGAGGAGGTVSVWSGGPYSGGYGGNGTNGTAASGTTGGKGGAGGGGGSGAAQNNTGAGRPGNNGANGSGFNGGTGGASVSYSATGGQGGNGGSSNANGANGGNQTGSSTYSSGGYLYGQVAGGGGGGGASGGNGGNGGIQSNGGNGGTPIPGKGGLGYSTYYNGRDGGTGGAGGGGGGAGGNGGQGGHSTTPTAGGNGVKGFLGGTGYQPGQNGGNGGGGGGTGQIKITTESNTGSAVDTPVQITLIDMTAPVLNTFIINNDVMNTPARTVSLMVTGSDNFGITQIQASEDPAFSMGVSSYTTTSSANQSTDFTLSFKMSTSLNTHTVYVKAFDAAGNVSNTMSQSINLLSDTEPPSIQQIVIDNGETQTKNNAIAIMVQGSDNMTGPDQLRCRVSTDGKTWFYPDASGSNWTQSNSVWGPYVPLMSNFPIGSTPGPVPIFVQLQDLAGNIGNGASQIILVNEQTTPAADSSSMTQTVNAGTSITNLNGYTILYNGVPTTVVQGNQVELDFTGLTNVSAVRFTTDGVIWSPYEPVLGDTYSKMLTFEKEGARAVSFQFKNAVGVESAIFTRNYLIDSTAPEVKAKTLSNSTATSGNSITMSIQTTDNVTTKNNLKYSLDQNTWNALPSNGQIIVPITRGTNSIVVYVLDQAGNIGQSEPVNIFGL